MATLHGAWVIDADGVASRREVSGEVGQQASGDADRGGIAVEGTGEGAQRVPRIPRACRAGAGVLVNPMMAFIGVRIS